MEKDLELLQQQIEEFCRKYSVTVKADTCSEGWNINGKLINIEAYITIMKGR